MPTVSIIIPTYNRSHIIGRALQSVLNQTYRDFEVIVADDGSTDGTEAVVKEFNDERIRYIRHEENKGVSAARNTAIKAAEGKYIAFQDSDDVWLEDKLEKQMKAFETVPPEVGIVYTGLWKIKGEEKEYVPQDHVKQKEGNIFSRLLHGTFICPSVAVVRKECFETAGMFDENMRSHEDWDLFLRMSKHYQFKYIDEPLVIKYLHEDNLSDNIEESIKGYEYLIGKHAAEFSKEIMAKRHFGFGIYMLSKKASPEGRSYFVKALKNNPFSPELWLYVIVASCFGVKAYRRVKNIYCGTWQFIKRIVRRFVKICDVLYIMIWEFARDIAGRSKEFSPKTGVGLPQARDGNIPNGEVESVADSERNHSHVQQGAYNGPLDTERPGPDL